MEELTISPPDTRSLCTVFYMIIHNSLFPEEKFCVNICLMPKFFQTPKMNGFPFCKINNTSPSKYTTLYKTW